MEVSPGNYYLSGGTIKELESKDYIDVVNSTVLSEKEYNALLLKKNIEKASTDIDKIEQNWGGDVTLESGEVIYYEGDNSISELVEISLDRRFENKKDFKPGKYTINGQTLNVTWDDIEGWKKYNKHQKEYREADVVDKEKLLHKNNLSELNKLNDIMNSLK